MLTFVNQLFELRAGRQAGVCYEQTTYLGAEQGHTTIRNLLMVPSALQGNSGHRELCKYGFDSSGKVESLKYTTLVTSKQSISLRICIRVYFWF